MNFKKQLPYLGKINPDDGLAEFEDGFPVKFSVRPDYQEFNENIFSSESDCVDVLVGIQRVNIFSLRISKKIAEMVHAGEDFPETKEWKILMGLETLLDKIQKVMSLGRASGKIEFYEHKELIGKPAIKEILEYNSHYFEQYRFYNRLSFLQWMKDNCYPIPDELSSIIPSTGNEPADHAVNIKNTSKLPKQVEINTPAGTTWDKIKFRIVRDSHIEITTPEGTDPYESVELGFNSKHILWGLFQSFAKERGSLLPMGGMGKIAPNMRNLQKHLKSLFPGISGNPIKKYIPGRGYECIFDIRNASHKVSDEPPWTDKEEIAAGFNDIRQEATHRKKSAH